MNRKCFPTVYNSHQGCDYLIICPSPGIFSVVNVTVVRTIYSIRFKVSMSFPPSDQISASVKAYCANCYRSLQVCRRYGDKIFRSFNNSAAEAEVHGFWKTRLRRWFENELSICTAQNLLLTQPSNPWSILLLSLLLFHHQPVL